MCTVVFIPTKNGIFFGSLRDESPKRPTAVAPKEYTHKKTLFVSPKDPLAGGTWIGLNNEENIIILLNGGFKNHEKRNNYFKSRGIIVTELLVEENPVVAWELMDLQDVEPFTLVMWCNKNLFQLVWDGELRHKILLNETCSYIWSSSTLYDEDAKIKRENMFHQWLSTKPVITTQSLLKFFGSYVDTDNGFLINRNEITKTLSYTSVEISKHANGIMSYIDFLNNTNQVCKVPLLDGIQKIIGQNNKV